VQPIVGLRRQSRARRRVIGGERRIASPRRRGRSSLSIAGTAVVINSGWADTGVLSIGSFWLAASIKLGRPSAARPSWHTRMAARTGRAARMRSITSGWSPGARATVIRSLIPCDLCPAFHVSQSTARCGFQCQSSCLAAGASACRIRLFNKPFFSTMRPTTSSGTVAFAARDSRWRFGGPADQSRDRPVIVSGSQRDAQNLRVENLFKVARRRHRELGVKLSRQLHSGRGPEWSWRVAEKSIRPRRIAPLSRNRRGVCQEWGIDARVSAGSSWAMNEGLDQAGDAGLGRCHRAFARSCWERIPAAA